MKIIGHRGAKGLAPENTLASFTKALEHNVDMIETDVHVTRDGVCVLEHDYQLKNQAGESFTITDHDYAELRRHKPELPTLAEAIECINRQVPFYIEVKERVLPEQIIALLKQYLAKGWQADDFLIASYDYGVLQACKVALPEVPLVVGERWSGARASYRARKLGTRNISIQQRWLWRGFITPMQQRGWRLFAYTMNDPAKAHRFGNYGLYAIFTDYPDLFT